MNERDEILYNLLKTMVCPAMKKMAASQGHIFIDSLNDLLVDTPFMLVAFGDGPGVMLREQALAFGQVMYDRPYKDYSP